MPSKRMIHPSFWESESISRYTMFERLFFAGLFSTADDQGRHKAHPVFLRSRIFPYDEIPLDEINDALDRFEYDGRIIRYEIDGKRYLQLVNWWTWQTPSWAWPSEHPAPEGWQDRVKYRRGNLVIEDNWNDDDSADESAPPDADTTADSPRDDSDPTMTPPRPHDDASLRSAPNGSSSGSSSSSGNDSDSSSSNARDGPAAAVSEETEDILRLLEAVPRLDMGVVRRKLPRWNLDDVPGWVEAIRDIAAPTAARILVARLDAGIPPPVDAEANPRRFIEGEYSDYIQH